MNNPEKPQNREVLDTSVIRQITFVIPAYNEADNLTSLIQNLNLLVVPEGINFSIVLSDNGSTDKTREITQNSVVREKPLILEAGSIPRSIGSARKKGVERAVYAFHKENTSANATNHIIVNFDADTQISSVDFLVAIQEIFSSPEVLVAYGPIDWISREGKIDKKYRLVQDLLSKLRLKRLFAAHGRKLSHYVNEPQTIFAGACTAIRESVLRNDYTLDLNFNELDRVGEDVRFSLELQKRLSTHQIIKDRRLSVLTSARGIETNSGKISTFKGIQRLIRVVLVGEHIPETTKKYLEKEGEIASNANSLNEERFNTSLMEVVESFIRLSDEETYNLNSDEFIGEVSTMSKRRYRVRRLLGEDIRPAMYATNREIIPGCYVVVRKKI